MEEETDIAPCHLWGDEEFDWAALDAASGYLEKQCKRWARLGIWTKEKYGTLRVSTTCAYITEFNVLHGVVYPGYCHYMFPNWFRLYVDWPLGKVLSKVGVIWLI